MDGSTNEAQYDELDLAVADIDPRAGNRAARNVEQLAEAIKAKGLLNRILVRATRGGGYELIAGERRWRAHQLLGLEVIGARVYPITTTDAEAQELAEIDNLQREDLTPLEEAESYERLRDRCRLTIAEVARRVGRTETLVRQRLRLLELRPEIRQLVESGALDLGAAEAIAQTPESVQKRLVKPLVDAAEGKTYRSTAGRISRDQVQDLLRQHAHQLDEAPFDITDGALVAGAPPCGVCPRRSGRQGVLVEVLDKADVCLDDSCWTTKADAAWAKKSEEAKAKGLKVLSDKESAQVVHYGRAQHDAPYKAATETVYVNDRQVQVAKLVGDDAPRVLARDKSTGAAVELVPKAAVDAAVKARAASSRKGASKSTSKADSAAQRAERERRQKVEILKRSQALAIRKVGELVAAGRAKTGNVLQAIIGRANTTNADAVCKALGIAFGKGVTSTAALLAHVVEQRKTKPSDTQLIAVLAQLELGTLVNTYGYGVAQDTPPELEALGIDLEELRKQAKQELAAEKATKSQPKASKAKATTKTTGKAKGKGKRSSPAGVPF